MGRRLTQKDLAIIKHDEEVYNSKVKRGEIVEKEGGRHIIHAQAPHSCQL